MTELLDWLGTLPAPLLYLVIGVAAFAENVFPPLPADTAIALGAFVAARGNGTPQGAWIATMVGNLGGAMAMYAVGRRFGLPWLERRFPSLIGEKGARRFEAQYRDHGMWGVFISRFLPGLRAIVPPVAGALHIAAPRAFMAMGIASGVWYALICWLAFRAGANADALLALISQSQRTVGLVAVGIVAIVIGIVWYRRRAARRQT